MIAMIQVMAVLAWYLDQVFPNEFGLKRHPLFIFGCFKPKKGKVNVDLKE